MDAETSASSTPQSLTAGEVAKTLGLRTDDVRTMVSDGLFPNAIRGRNGAVRFPADQLPTWAEVEALLRAQRDRHLQRSLVLLDRLTSELEAVRNDIVETLYRGMADDTVGKIIDTTLRQNLIIVDEMGFAPLDNTGTQLLFRLVAGAYDRRYLAIASPWSFAKGGPTPARTHYRRQHPRPAPTSRHHLHPQRFLPRDPPNGGAPPLNQTALGEDFHLAIVFAA